MDVAGRSDFGGHDNVHHHNLYAWVQNCYQEDDQFYYDRFLNNTCIANSASGGFESDCHLALGMEVSGNKIFTASGKLDVKICNSSNVVVGAWPNAAVLQSMARKILGF